MKVVSISWSHFFTIKALFKTKQFEYEEIII